MINGRFTAILVELNGCFYKLGFFKGPMVIPNIPVHMLEGLFLISAMLGSLGASYPKGPKEGNSGFGV